MKIKLKELLKLMGLAIIYILLSPLIFIVYLIEKISNIIIYDDDRKKGGKKMKCKDCGFFVACDKCSKKFAKIDKELDMEEIENG